MESYGEGFYFNINTFYSLGLMVRKSGSAKIIFSTVLVLVVVYPLAGGHSSCAQHLPDLSGYKDSQVALADPEEQGPRIQSEAQSKCFCNSL